MDGTPEDLGGGSSLGSIALVRSVEVVELKERSERWLQLISAPGLASTKDNPPIANCELSRCGPQAGHASAMAMILRSSVVWVLPGDLALMTLFFLPVSSHHVQTVL